jgi:energy-coupling factor transporter ATP-binding protein EcfA2
VPISIKYNGGDSYIEAFNIENLPDLCIVTGINGSGKSRLLSLIKSGEVELYLDGRIINNKRVVLFDPNNFSSLRFQDKRGDNSQYVRTHHDYMSQEVVIKGCDFSDYNSVVIAVEAFLYEMTGHHELDGVLDTIIRNVVSLSNSQVDRVSDVNQYIAELNSLLIRYRDEFRLQEYDDSIPYSLKIYYDTLVSNEITALAAYKGIEVAETAEIYNVEDMINSVMEKMNLPYMLTGGEAYRSTLLRQRLRAASANLLEETVYPGLPFEFSINLVNKTNKSTMSIDHLSSGEKSLISLAVIMMHEAQGYQNKSRPAVLLIDEPDAHLHPEFCSLLVKIMNETFIELYGIKLIVSTHSPITLTVANVDNLIEMNSGRIRKVDSSAALKSLLSTLPYISLRSSENKYTIVESQKDADLYTKMFAVLQQIRHYTFNALFFPSSSIDDGGNMERVKHVVNVVPEGELLGIIDWDHKNASNGRVKVMAPNERYSKENLIYDPLVMVAFLINMSISSCEDFGLPKNTNVSQILSCSQNQLEEACMIYVLSVINDESNVKIPVNYLGDINLQISQEYLYCSSHKLENKIYDRYPGLKTMGSRVIPNIINFLNNHRSLIPMAYVRLFDEMYK